MPKTKIICTLGPASNSATVLRKMMRFGMDVARLNFSHAAHREHLGRILMIRQLNKKYRRHIRILGDLEGHRTRVGRLKDHKPITLLKRQVLWLVQKEFPGHDKYVPFDYPGEVRDIATGQHIFIDDGNIALVVTGRSKNSLKTKVLIGGILRERKGINIPGAKLYFGGLTGKDKEDIFFCIKNDVDYIAQSFVRTQDDILQIRRILKDNPGEIKIVAKIENREGIKNIDEIIAVSEGIMIARGDMGISIPIYEVPMVQKEIIKKCNQAKKVVITATQMLESMTDSHLPRRAEVSDVANAILDGSDYLMLSAETAIGRYPAETVEMMNQIIKYTESHSVYKNKKRRK
jgi:pyruvate kinase